MVHVLEGQTKAVVKQDMNIAVASPLAEVDGGATTQVSELLWEPSLN